jgi:hypothetical protein
MPLPRLGIVRIADARHDRAGAHVAKVNLPAFLAMLWRSAAGESGRAP